MRRWLMAVSRRRMDVASRQALSGSTLTIAKGDLMYRKILGDRTFEPTEEFDDIVCYFPSPLLTLRSCPPHRDAFPMDPRVG